EADSGGAGQRLQGPALEEGAQPLRCLEEIERVARWRGIEDQEVEVVLLVELVELGHRAALLRTRNRGRELPVDAVGLDLLGSCWVGGDAVDQLVKRSLRVE